MSTVSASAVEQQPSRQDRRRPVPLPVTRQWLGQGWSGLIGWSAGIAVVIFIYLPIYPSMQSPELVGMMDALPPELVRTLGFESITTGAGYAQATFFGLLGFALLTIAGISWGAAFIGGAEESGRLELTLAHGVGRVGFALQSALALVVKLLVLGAVGWLLIWALNGPAELGLEPANLVAVSTAWVGLALLSATAAFAGGALSGRRSWGIRIGAGVAVLGYVLQAAANNSDDLDWVRRFSPYAWAYGGEPLRNGYDWTGLALLWGGSIVLVGVGTWALSRRDILG